MIRPSLTIRHLIFTGPAVEPAQLTFESRPNLVWGASNTGKSFTLKALDFMLGGSKPLPDIEHLQGYETILLGLSLNGVGDVTLERAVKGGSFALHEGLLKVSPGTQPARVLLPKHQANKDNSLSTFLLQHLGLAGKLVAENTFGRKVNLTFRDLARLVLIDETSIQAENSPVETGQRDDIIANRSVFRLMLTGSDDSAITTLPDAKTFKTSKATRLEVVDEMLASIEAELAAHYPDPSGLAAQDERLAETLQRLQSDFDSAQGSISTLLEQKRLLARQIPNATGRLGEIEVHLGRFAQLDAIYASDIDRLDALEEAGFLFTLGRDRPCPVCGAPPESQKHEHEFVTIGQLQDASAAEIMKIEQQRVDLARTVDDMKSEREQLNASLPKLRSRLDEVEKEINGLSPKVADNARILREVLAARDHVREGLALLERKSALVAKRKEFEMLKTAPKDAKPNLDVSGIVVNDFCQVVARVLRSWGFPGNHQVSFDEKAYDLRIDGKPRINNGKGVRAITHAAFDVALLMFCRDRNLPHPGFLVLDTPLLTYRDPIANPKFGELSDDERQLANTPVRQKFFEHLAEIQSLGQFIVLENVDLPANVTDLANLEVFVGDAREGRPGFFPRPKTQAMGPGRGPTGPGA